MTCSQKDRDNAWCGRPAVGRYTWPGRNEAGICALHLPHLQGIANALGLHLQVLPVEPALGTIRCVECGRQYEEFPQNCECTSCGGDVSQLIGDRFRAAVKKRKRRRKLEKAGRRAARNGLLNSFVTAAASASKCGKMRAKAEGGTTFTVCDECWCNHWGKTNPDHTCHVCAPPPEGPSEEDLVTQEISDLKYAVAYLEKENERLRAEHKTQREIANCLGRELAGMKAQYDALKATMRLEQ